MDILGKEKVSISTTLYELLSGLFIFRLVICMNDISLSRDPHVSPILKILIL
jgi:hypothetical protein